MTDLMNISEKLYKKIYTDDYVTKLYNFNQAEITKIREIYLQKEIKPQGKNNEKRS
jgi:hypothetical protein